MCFIGPKLDAIYKIRIRKCVPVLISSDSEDESSSSLNAVEKQERLDNLSKVFPYILSEVSNFSKDDFFQIYQPFKNGLQFFWEFLITLLTFNGFFLMNNSIFNFNFSEIFEDCFSLKKINYDHHFRI